MEIMSANEYELGCLKTESEPNPEMKKRLSDYANSLGSTLHEISAIGSRADSLKKLIFYGKMVGRTEAQRTVAADFTNSFVSIDKRCDAEMLRILHCLLGLVTEAAEIANELTDAITEEREINVVNIAEELGDAQWYIPIGAKGIGFSLSEIMEVNLSKLRTRYGDKFDQDKALNRDLKREEKVLNSAFGEST